MSDYNVPGKGNNSGGLTGGGSGGGGSDKIGTPADGTYTDGMFGWTPNTKIANALDDVNELLAALAPPKPADLFNQPLTISVTRYNARLSAGLPADRWYPTGFAAGSLLTNALIVTGTYTLSTPTSGNVFFLGRAGATATYGTVTHVFSTPALTNQNGASYDMGLGENTAANGQIEAFGYGNVNAIWQYGRARLKNWAQPQEGYYAHRLSHSLTGASASLAVWLDNRGASLAFDLAGFTPIFEEIAAPKRYLSGVPYYTTGTQFRVQFRTQAGIFNPVYHPTNPGRIVVAGANPLAILPGAAPQFGAIMDCALGGNFGPQNVTLTVAGQASNTRQISVELWKPQTTSPVTHNIALPFSINTWTDGAPAATDLAESFLEETRRVSRTDLSLNPTAWNSSVAISNGDAQVRNGVLCYPVAGDYDGAPAGYPTAGPFTGQQEYHRFIVFPQKNGGSIRVQGTGLTLVPYDTLNTASGGAGYSLLILMKDDATGTTDVWYDIAVPGGTPTNSSGSARDGSSKGQALGARDSGNLNGFQNYTQGTISTGTTAGPNKGKYRLVVVFGPNATAAQITNITVQDKV